MNGYKPTTEQARDAWRRDRVWAFGAPAVEQRNAAEEGFDAWLADIVKAAQIDAWEAGASDMIRYLASPSATRGSYPANRYYTAASA